MFIGTHHAHDPARTPKYSKSAFSLSLSAPSMAPSAVIVGVSWGHIHIQIQSSRSGVKNNAAYPYYSRRKRGQIHDFYFIVLLSFWHIFLRVMVDLTPK